MVYFQVTKSCREELLSVLSLLNVTSVVGHIIAHTISYFLLVELRGRYYQLKKNCVTYLESFKIYCKLKMRLS